MLNTVEIDERIEKCERILKENPQSQIFAALAEVLRKKGELDQAFRVCMQGLRLHPDYGPGRLVMARISFDRKMYDWAERELEQAIKLEGRTRATDLLEVEILIERGFFSKAKVILDKLSVSDPKNELYLSLQNRIAEGKQKKKAELAETEEFYRLKMKQSKAGEFRGISDIAQVDEPITYDTALELIAESPIVDAVFYMNLDGTVGESHLPENFDINAHSSCLTEIGRFAASEIGSIGLERWTEILIEAQSQQYLLISLGDRILVSVCRPDVNLGSLKLRLQKIAKSLWME
jgi:predicted regulator of Ras-like GTPase activity (Roadblock/LC7/MglB family)